MKEEEQVLGLDLEGAYCVSVPESVCGQGESMKAPPSSRARQEKEQSSQGVRSGDRGLFFTFLFSKFKLK